MDPLLPQATFHRRPRHRRWMLAIAASTAVMAGLGVWWGSRETASRPAERARHELRLREGRLLFEGQPFTGVVFDLYPGGSMKSRSSVSNGLLEGLSQGWYTNGTPQVTEFYRQGVSHGTRTKYHPDGRRQSVVTVVNGQLNGLFQRWHPGGALAEQIPLTNGVPHGESLAYYPDGALKARARHELGTLLEQRHWEAPPRP